MLAGKILDFTTLTRPNVPAIENKMSFSFNFERFKYPSCSAILIFDVEVISPLSISIFSTLTKLTSPFPDLSFGVVPFVISEHSVPSLRCSQVKKF